MFKRRKDRHRTEIRDTRLPAPAGWTATVDYDAATWIRLPAPDEDLVEWRARTRAAYLADLGWSPGSPHEEYLTAALGKLAAAPAERTATFAHLSFKDPLGLTVATLDLLPAADVAARYGDVDTWLSFADLEPGDPVQPYAWAAGIRQAIKVVSEAGQPLVLTRTHRDLADTGSALAAVLTSEGVDGQASAESPALVAKLTLAPA